MLNIKILRFNALKKHLKIKLIFNLLFVYIIYVKSSNKSFISLIQKYKKFNKINI
jgi:hypothetical protein